MAATVNQQLALVRNPLLNAYVSSLGRAIAAVSGRPSLNYRFYIINSEAVNAFALPGGHIYVTRGLIARTRSGPELAGVLSPQALVSLLDAALHRGTLTPTALDAALARFSGCRHVAALRNAVALADGRAESPHETLTRLLLLPVLPGLVPQVRLRDAGGRVIARLDLGEEELRLAVEADGRRGHAGDAMAAKDRRRDGVARRLGWTTERVTWHEVRCEQEQTRRRIAATAA
ncbi:MAG: M48 family metalloprotease, partial [Gemmatimonadetes bacterium]|nr:M48 family metalloprotease [Gemmatimonadota bacterium]